MQKVFPIKADSAIFEPVETVANYHKTRKCIQIIDPEFSSVCPKTGLPDYGRVILRYVPDEHCVELKSWKLFLRSFYGVGMFHEECTNRIIEEFVEEVQPRWASVLIDWGARGGLHTTTSMNWTKKGYAAFPEHWEDQVFTKHARDWNNR